MIATTVACVLALVVLLDAELALHRRSCAPAPPAGAPALLRTETQRFAAKILASCAFLATAGLALSRPGGATLAGYGGWIVLGLVLGLAGDVALLWKRGFVIGLAVFLAGHVAYIIAIATVEPPRAWPSDGGVLGIIPPLAGVAVLAQLWPRLGKLRGPVIVYVLAIATMVVAALAAWRAATVPPTLALGAVLFFASDIAVARHRFVGPTFTDKAWGLPAYYAAQLLIAWSLA